MSINLAQIFGKKKAPTPSYLVIDFGSCYLRAAVFSPIDPVKMALVSCVGRPQKAGAVQGGMIVDVAAVKETAAEAVREACLAGGGVPSAVLCGLSGEAVKEFYTSVRFSRENSDLPLTERELEKLAAKIKEISFMEIEKDLTEVTGSAEREAEIINTRLAGFKVDGYPLSEPFGFTGKLLEVALCSAVSPATYLSRLKAVLKSLKLPPAELVGHLAAAAAVLKQVEGANFNALLLDIGGEKTDVAVVFGGAVIGSRTFGIGGAHFTRSLKDKFLLEEKVAEGKKLAYSRRELPSEESEKIKEALDPPLNFWRRGLEVALADFSGVKTFPDKVWLWGGGSLLPEILSSLQSFPWTVNFPFLAPPRIITAGRGLFSSCLENRRGQALEDSDLLLASLGLWPLRRSPANYADSLFRT